MQKRDDNPASWWLRPPSTLDQIFPVTKVREFFADQQVRPELSYRAIPPGPGEYVSTKSLLVAQVAKRQPCLRGQPSLEMDSFVMVNWGASVGANTMPRGITVVRPSAVGKTVYLATQQGRAPALSDWCDEHSDWSRLGLSALEDLRRADHRLQTIVPALGGGYGQNAAPDEIWPISSSSTVDR